MRSVLTRLYLDTARLGLMSRSAQQVQIDFVRFAGEEPASLYFDQFLTSGTRQWPESMCRRFPALEAWQGISPLKAQLRRPVDAPPEWNVLLASRSAQLMKLAARLLFQLCRNVLVTDLSWPSYRFILDRIRSRVGNQVTSLPLRRRILKYRIAPQEVVDRTVRCFLRHGCDGLFLPAVDNLGVRVPVERIVRAIRQQAELRFVVVDGAQAFCHVPMRLIGQYCDFFICGCHKWLGAYHPLGLGFYGHPRSASYIEQTTQRLQRCGAVDDPLMQFLCELNGKALNRYGETVNLAPLFSCQGALRDVTRDDPTVSLRTRLANADQLAELLSNRGWRPLRPARALRTGILLLQPAARAARAISPEVLRQRFHQAGLAVSTYPKGTVRLSLPAKAWHHDDLDHIVHAFDLVATSLEPLSAVCA